VHHVAAVVMMLGTAWHLLVMGYHVFVLRSRMSMLPTLQDAFDGLQALRYNIGLAKSYPQMGRYTFEEKMEYWAFVWGAIIMGLTGFLMWNPIMVTRLLPGELVPAAKAAHGAEAVLAVLAIIVWHMYGVHLKRLNKAMWTGRQTETEMLHEHPLELADLKAGIADRRPSPAVIRSRQRIFYPLAALLTAIMLGAVYGFVNLEQTALTTLPPHERVQVFVPQTATPTATIAPTQAVTAAAPPAEPTASDTWDSSVGTILQQKCATCHGAPGMAGLDLTTFGAALTGGTSGAAIVPGDASSSLLVARQQAGGHPGQLSPEEVALVAAWIDAGAPER
jgi:mono/diheme cytochrome c family protein